MKELPLYYHDRFVGTISRKEEGLSFHYDLAWKGGGFPLSLSLPFDTPPDDLRFVRFFRNMIPEGNILVAAARQKKVSPTDTFGMLAAYGADMAGAFSTVPCAIAPMREYVDVTGKIIDTLESGNNRPVFADMANKMSLAGAQDKLACVYRDGKILLPADGSPTTHIIKPEHSFAVNEFMCTTLARASGLPVPAVQYIDIGGHMFLLAERYDRIQKNGVVRLHQEDFCQATGRSVDQKYESQPNGIGFADLGKCIRAYGLGNVQSLAEIAAYNICIGNGDAHGKNFSILYEDERKLAPFYDLSSSTLASFDDGFAMMFGNASQLGELERASIELFSESIGLPTEETVEIMQSVCRRALQNVDVLERLDIPQDDITKMQVIVKRNSEILLGVLEEMESPSTSPGM